MKTQLLNLTDIVAKELIANAEVRFIHTNNMTLAYWNFEPGSTVHEHAHPHEQVTNVISGEFELVVDGTSYRLTAGTALIIPPHATHSGAAITQCQLIDVFHPVREDYM